MSEKCSVIASNLGTTKDFGQALHLYLNDQEGDRYSDRRGDFLEGIRSYLSQARVDDVTVLEGLARKLYDRFEENNGNRFNFNPVNVGWGNDEYRFHFSGSMRNHDRVFVHDSSLPRLHWLQQLRGMAKAGDNLGFGESIFVLPFINWDGESAYVVPGEIYSDHTSVITIDAVHKECEKYRVPISNLNALPTMGSKLLERRIDSNWVVLTHGEILDRSSEFLDSEDFQDRVSLEKLRGEDFSNAAVLLYDVGHIGDSQLELLHQIKDAGAEEVVLCNPHGIFQSQDRMKRAIREFDSIYVGDTVKQESQEGLHTISLVELVGKQIYERYAQRPI